MRMVAAAVLDVDHGELIVRISDILSGIRTFIHQRDRNGPSGHTVADEQGFDHDAEHVQEKRCLFVARADCRRTPGGGAIRR